MRTRLRAYAARAPNTTTITMVPPAMSTEFFRDDSA